MSYDNKRTWSTSILAVWHSSCPQFFDASYAPAVCPHPLSLAINVSYYTHITTTVAVSPLLSITVKKIRGSWERVFKLPVFILHGVADSFTKQKIREQNYQRMR